MPFLGKEGREGGRGREGREEGGGGGREGEGREGGGRREGREGGRRKEVKEGEKEEDESYRTNTGSCATEGFQDIQVSVHIQARAGS